ncbi:carboxypeptidase-like regulatory domain-containing protein [Longimicrobium sp.]|uniref:carboxypeptidase-like regulatory domain-containing protein n=1 Tax=Longimicrobium sp. TaxID=2029185 RepID=UPI002BDFB5EF|nr:carboxypeptidase-like regulatory domain-containing protein [Longimicrobium sp.]HSU16376.1 carboxypeptidase-like regulatory domain-containing protein [Longimicrobium sp.]
MIRRIVPLSIFLLCLAVPAAAQQQAQAAPGGEVLTGVVLDARSLQPVRAARVRVPGARVDVLTDAEGRFIAQGVAPGQYGAMVSLLGYRQSAQIFTVAPREPEPQVLLEPNPVLLRALTVTAGRLERRARASGASLMGFNHDFLLASNDHDAAIFVRQMAHLTPAPCSTFSTDSGSLNCLRIRGVPERPCVLINDTPSSFGELAMYRPRELYRVEVYKGGRAILAYTSTFAEELALRGWRPPPVESMVEMYCRKGPSLM